MDSPLAGLTVIDAGTIIAGPMAALLLAEYGATVIKVEHPLRGDGARAMSTSAEHRGYWWKFLSHNKKSVTCDLSQRDGAALFHRLCDQADVLIENFRPGTMERWGLDYATLSASNPGLVMLRLSGFGKDGPYAKRPAYGTIIEAMTGFAHMTGQPGGPPTLPGAPTADPLAGVMGAQACMMALWARDRPGGTRLGQEIDLSLYGPMLFAFGMFVVESDKLGIVPERRGNRYGNAPRNLKECADGGWVAYAVVAESGVAAAVRFAGLAEDPRFADHASTLRHADLLDEALGAWIGRQSQAVVVEAFASAGIPATAVYDTAQLVADQQVRARGDLVRARDEFGEEFLMPQGPARFSRGATVNGPAGQALGASNEEIYSDWLKVPAAELESLKRAGII